MTTRISSCSSHVTVYSSPTYVPIGNLTGTVRFNPYTQSLEVADGNSWVNVSPPASIGLSVEAEQAICWAIGKMNKEKRYAALSASSSTFCAAMENLKKVEEELEVLAILLENNNVQKN